MTTSKLQWPILAVLIVLVPVGLATKFYNGPMQSWVHAYAGDIFYPMFWYFLAALLFPDARPTNLCLLVFFFSTFVEFTQLSNDAILLWLRHSFIGRTLVGSSFSLLDIVYYYIGSQLAVFLHLGLYFFMLPCAPSEPQRHNNSLQARRN